jgi:uncharacterized membrane protein YcaP (DUF421 family)
MVEILDERGVYSLTSGNGPLPDWQLPRLRENMFFDGWEGIFRTIIVGVLAYIALIFLLRISGKRTLSKMNAFDLVVTVALGSTLATILLSQDVPLAEGVVALGILIFLQFIITWTSVRSDFVRRMVKSQPTLIYHRGEFLEDQLHKHRLPHQEVYSAVRSAGYISMENVMAIVLETDGTLTVLPYSDQPATALKNIENYSVDS